MPCLTPPYSSTPLRCADDHCVAGTRRAVNPQLGLAGDGVGAAQLPVLRALCVAHPKVKFMATVLSPTDQHEVAALHPPSNAGLLVVRPLRLPG